MISPVSSDWIMTPQKAFSMCVSLKMVSRSARSAETRSGAGLPAIFWKAVGRSAGLCPGRASVEDRSIQAMAEATNQGALWQGGRLILPPSLATPPLRAAPEIRLLAKLEQLHEILLPPRGLQPAA